MRILINDSDTLFLHDTNISAWFRCFIVLSLRTHSTSDVLSKYKQHRDKNSSNIKQVYYLPLLKDNEDNEDLLITFILTNG